MLNEIMRRGQMILLDPMGNRTREDVDDPASTLTRTHSRPRAHARQFVAACNAMGCDNLSHFQRRSRLL